MAQQSFFVRHLDITETPRSVATCTVLEGTTRLAPTDAGGLIICVVRGSGVAQREVAGHWVDCCAFFNGGVLVLDGHAPVRFRWRSMAEGVALTLSADSTSPHFSHVQQAIAKSAVVQMALDAVAASLAKVLAFSCTNSMGEGITENMGEVLAVRIAQMSRDHLLPGRPRSGALPSWRFRRVETMVLDKLDEDVTLADMALAAGLSPMHFAAQFRASTGMRPHHYLLLQRIEKAKVMLSHSGSSILDVALSVGFQTQAHFTTVFKRLEQTTPRHWRQSRMAA